MIALAINSSAIIPEGYQDSDPKRGNFEHIWQ